jgi:hypothetical protein
MKCFFCNREACAKVGSSKASIWKALFGGKALEKIELYTCQNCLGKAKNWNGELITKTTFKTSKNGKHVTAEREWIALCQ